MSRAAPVDARALERAAARVREAGGAELAERLAHLDRVVAERIGPRPTATTNVPAAVSLDGSLDCDVLLAGGGLWSIVAPLLAQRGLRVWVADRARAGAAHREWNASRSELEALVRIGLVTTTELSSLVAATYRHGFCRFGAGVDHVVTDVLDHAVDAGALLRHARARGEALGVMYLDGMSVEGEIAGVDRVRATLVDLHGARQTTFTRVLIDARGAASPYASADILCPTVGGVLTGLRQGNARDEVDPTVGEILVTNEPIEGGRQHIWEGFPGRPGETTVYLFYYADRHEPASLLSLYARFFDTMPRYKSGDFTVVRPTFGFIPGWSRLTPAPRAPSRRIVLVGDAAARHSPLTFCGFGGTLRSLAPVVEHVTNAVSHGVTPPEVVVDDAPLHRVTGAMARMMATRALTGDSINVLLDAAFQAARDGGEAELRAFLKDELAPRGVVRLLRRMAGSRTDVWGKAWRGLGTVQLMRTALAIARA